ncbi:MAG TPA: hypothetical protein VKA68_14715 [bacterium]|nr:hypothetical protein [bacterium]
MLQWAREASGGAPAVASSRRVAWSGPPIPGGDPSPWNNRDSG